MSTIRPPAASLPPASRPDADGLPSSRSTSSITNRATSRWNGNTATGRRCRDLFRGYLRALGMPTDAPTVALAIAAAEAVVLAEVARLECLAGLNGMTAELMIRLENTANRSLRRLGLAKVAPKAPRKSMMERLQEKDAARQANPDDGGAA